MMDSLGLTRLLWGDSDFISHSIQEETEVRVIWKGNHISSYYHFSNFDLNLDDTVFPNDQTPNTSFSVSKAFVGCFPICRGGSTLTAISDAKDRNIFPDTQRN